MSINRCDICAQLEFKSCSSSITLDVGLVPAGDYYVWLTDKNGHSYNINVQAGGGGSIIVLLSDFVSIFGLSFIRDSGVWELSISDNESTESSEILTINGTGYPCINLSFFDLN